MSAPGIHPTDRQRPVTVAEIDERFDGVTRGLEALGTAIGALAAKLEDHDRRFDAIEKKLKAHGRRFDKLDEKVDKLDEKVDKLLNHFNLH